MSRPQNTNTEGPIRKIFLEAPTISESRLISNVSASRELVPYAKLDCYEPQTKEWAVLLHSPLEDSLKQFFDIFAESFIHYTIYDWVHATVQEAHIP